MLRATSVFLVSMLMATAAIAQNQPNYPGRAGHTGQRQNMAAMHQQMMQSLQADLDAMRANLQKMKDQLGKVSDPSTKEQMQLNIDMWQTVLDNIDKHMTMMKQMMGSRHGRMAPGEQQPPPTK